MQKFVEHIRFHEIYLNCIILVCKNKEGMKVMKKITVTLALGALLIGGTFVNPSTTDAAAQKFKNCTELNKAYTGGVSKSAGVVNKGGKTKYKPTVNKALYDANSSKDRDNDGIACER